MRQITRTCANKTWWEDIIQMKHWTRLPILRVKIRPRMFLCQSRNMELEKRAGLSIILQLLIAEMQHSNTRCHSRTIWFLLNNRWVELHQLSQSIISISKTREVILTTLSTWIFRTKKATQTTLRWRIWTSMCQSAAKTIGAPAPQTHSTTAPKFHTSKTTSNQVWGAKTTRENKQFNSLTTIYQGTKPTILVTTTRWCTLVSKRQYRHIVLRTEFPFSITSLTNLCRQGGLQIELLIMQAV